MFEAIYSTEVTLESGKHDGDAPSLERLPYAFLCQRLRERVVQERVKHDADLENVQQEVRAKIRREIS
jgi:predicted mannosyl-3-phosphoglycerate phosphatase (HAD superfamily)